MIYSDWGILIITTRAGAIFDRSPSWRPPSPECRTGERNSFSWRQVARCYFSPPQAAAAGA